MLKRGIFEHIEGWLPTYAKKGEIQSWPSVKSTRDGQSWKGMLKMHSPRFWVFNTPEDAGCFGKLHFLRDFIWFLTSQQWDATTNLVDPASCHMLVSRTKPCKCQSTRVLIRGVCVRLIKRFIVSPTKRAVMPSYGISLRNAKLIPVRIIVCYQTPRGNLKVWRTMWLAETKIDARTEQL